VKNLWISRRLKEENDPAGGSHRFAIFGAAGKHLR
jgi:hypothetical protein